jgi:peptidoglycan/xylan/chitin deacetylase (PgdA/CDA1 family)
MFGAVIRKIGEMDRERPRAAATRALRKAITAGAPLIFTRLFYGNNRGLRSWGGKRACLTLSWDCDLPEDLAAAPRLLDLLRDRGLRTCFACVGKWIEREPDLHRRILAEGHEILNHSHTHPSNAILHPDRRFNQLSAREQEEEIRACHETCRRLLGYEPAGFRTPHFGNAHTDGVDEILTRVGYRYSSSRPALRTPAFGAPYRPRVGLVEFPLSFYPREPFQVFETWRYFRAPGARGREDEFFAMFRFLIDLAVDTNSYVNLYLDPIDTARFRDFARFLDYVRERGDDLRCARYADLLKDEASHGTA